MENQNNRNETPRKSCNNHLLNWVKKYRTKILACTAGGMLAVGGIQYWNQNSNINDQIWKADNESTELFKPGKKRSQSIDDDKTTRSISSFGDLYAVAEDNLEGKTKTDILDYLAIKNDELEKVIKNLELSASGNVLVEFESVKTKVIQEIMPAIHNAVLQKNSNGDPYDAAKFQRNMDDTIIEIDDLTYFPAAWKKSLISLILSAGLGLGALGASFKRTNKEKEQKKDKKNEKQKEKNAHDLRIKDKENEEKKIEHAHTLNLEDKKIEKTKAEEKFEKDFKAKKSEHLAELGKLFTAEKARRDEELAIEKKRTDTSKMVAENQLEITDQHIRQTDNEKIRTDLIQRSYEETLYKAARNRLSKLLQDARKLSVQLINETNKLEDKGELGVPKSSKYTRIMLEKIWSDFEQIATSEPVKIFKDLHNIWKEDIRGIDTLGWEEVPNKLTEMINKLETKRDSLPDLPNSSQLKSFDS